MRILEISKLKEFALNGIVGVNFLSMVKGKVLSEFKYLTKNKSFVKCAFPDACVGDLDCDNYFSLMDEKEIIFDAGQLVGEAYLVARLNKPHYDLLNQDKLLVDVDTLSADKQAVFALESKIILTKTKGAFIYDCEESGRFSQIGNNKSEIDAELKRKSVDIARKIEREIGREELAKGFLELDSMYDSRATLDFDNQFVYVKGVLIEDEEVESDNLDTKMMLEKDGGSGDGLIGELMDWSRELNVEDDSSSLDGGDGAVREYDRGFDSEDDIECFEEEAERDFYDEDDEDERDFYSDEELDEELDYEDMEDEEQEDDHLDFKISGGICDYSKFAIAKEYLPYISISYDESEEMLKFAVELNETAFGDLNSEFLSIEREIRSIRENGLIRKEVDLDNIKTRLLADDAGREQVLFRLSSERSLNSLMLALTNLLMNDNDYFIMEAGEEERIYAYGEDVYLSKSPQDDLVGNKRLLTKIIRDSIFK